METSVGAGKRLQKIITMVVLIGVLFSAFPQASGKAGPQAGPTLAMPILARPKGFDLASRGAPGPADEAGAHAVFIPIAAKGSSAGVVIGPEGGAATWLDGEVQINLPAGAVDEPTTLALATTSAAPASLYDYGIKLDIKAYNQAGVPVNRLKKPATLTFSYEKLDFWIYPKLAVASQSANGEWTNVYSEYVPGKKQVRAQVDHFSVFGLFGREAIPYGRMAGDAAGRLYVLSSDGDVYRYLPGAQQGELYADLPMGLEYNGDLAFDSDSETLYIANGKKIYQLTADKQLSIFYEDAHGAEVTGISYSPYYKDLVVSVCGYPTSEWCRRRDIETDSKGRVFENGDQWGSAGLWAISIREQPKGAITDFISGFSLPGRMAMGQDDVLYVANTNDNAITILSGDKPAVEGYIRVTAPQNVVLMGTSLAVFTQGGVKSFLKTQRDAFTDRPYLLSGQSISGKGSVMKFGGVVTPVNTSLYLNGCLVRAIASFDALHHVIAYDLAGGGGHSEDCFTPKSAVYGYAGVYGYQENWGVYQLWNGDKLALSGAIATPTPGNYLNVYIYDTYHLARGIWGIFSGLDATTCRVVSNDGLFPDWQARRDGLALAYQFNQVGEFTFTIYPFDTGSPEPASCRETPDQTITVTISAKGQIEEGATQGLYDLPVDPVEGAILNYRGVAILQIPDGALPGAAAYSLDFQVGNIQYPGKDAIDEYSYRFSFKLQPEPDCLLKPIVLWLPYDPAAMAESPKAGYYDPNVGDVVMLDSTIANGYIQITFPVGSYQGEPESRSTGRPGQMEGPGNFGALNKIGADIRWAVGLPNEKVEDQYFSVIYNTGDVTESYAQTILDALNTARNSFSSGWTMPTNRVIVKVAPWIAGGTRSGVTISLLFNYHIFINDRLSTADLQDTAAHEFFHVLQRKNLSVEGYLATPTWWLEATATWAQWVVYPSHNGYEVQIYDRMDFPNTGFDAWGSLDEYYQYAAMALPAYLEHKYGAGTVKEVFDNLSIGTMGVDLSIQGAAGTLFGLVYRDFARDYWTQQYAPVSKWMMWNSTNVDVVTVTAASNTLLQYPANLSSGLLRVYYDGAPNPPPSFNNATGSVARMQLSCPKGRVYIFDRGGQSLGNLEGSVPEERAISLQKIGQYTKSNPLYVLYINYEDPGGACWMHALWETPSITSLSPSSVPANQTQSVTIYGGGFGPKAGKVHTGSGDFIPSYWSASQVIFTLPAQEAPGTVSIQVQLPSGELSNPVTVTRD